MAWRNARGSQMVLVGAPGATMDCETLHVTIVHKTTQTLNIMCWRTACSDGWTCIMRIQATPNHLTDDKTYTRLSQKKKHNNEPTWILSADKVKYYWAACIKRGGGEIGYMQCDTNLGLILDDRRRLFGAVRKTWTKSWLTDQRLNVHFYSCFYTQGWNAIAPSKASFRLHHCYTIQYIHCVCVYW